MTGTRARDMDIIKIYTLFALWPFLSGIILILNLGVCCLLEFFSFCFWLFCFPFRFTPSRLLVMVLDLYS